MGKQRRDRLTAEQKAEIWQRWKGGQSLKEIAQALDRQAPNILWMVERCGGFKPPTRRRALRSLSLAEREEISRGVAAGWGLRQIAQAVGRSPSTISREIQRNGGRRRYRAAGADRCAWDRARRPKACLLAGNTQLREAVAAKLAQEWSPQQISGWLERQYPDDETMRVSHETIYRSLFIQARGVLKQELLLSLRSRRRMRRPKAAAKRGPAVQGISIRERPAAIQDRAVPGHWEGDLLYGGQQSQIATLVERHSRFVMLVKTPRRDTDTVVRALTKKILDLPEHLRISLTWDRGAELAAHRDFTVATDVAVYFCDPHSPWQRGTNENTNGLLRQYFPHGMDLSQVTQVQLDAVARRLNQRPRKTLGFQTPADKLSLAVASTL
jgi:IS30 family transposase